jgi:hypothetical protein
MSICEAIESKREAASSILAHAEAGWQWQEES